MTNYEVIELMNQEKKITTFYDLMGIIYKLENDCTSLACKSNREYTEGYYMGEANAFHIACKLIQNLFDNKENEK